MSDPFNRPQPELNIIVPAWRDDFDLTEFFRKLEPSGFQFRDSRELASAQDLFRHVQHLILRWAALYRAVVRAANAHPEAVARTVKCVRQMGTMDWNTYRSWFTTSDKEFEGASPHDWFVRNNLEEFTPLLGGEQPGSTADPIVTLGNSYPWQQSVGSPVSAQGVGPCSQLNDNVAALLGRLKTFATAEIEPGFDLMPLLNRCKPQNQKFSSTSDRLLASEIFMVLEAESWGWLNLYRAALAIARERGEILPRIVLCLQKLQLLGFERYLEWYRCAQAEFDERSPESFFVAEDLVNLAFLLGAGV